MRLGSLGMIAGELALAFFLVTAASVTGGADPTSPPRPAESAGAAAATGTGPKIQFAAPVHDFGQVVGGEVLKHAFVFTNTGDRRLDLGEVRSSCGCVTTGDWARQIEAGKAGAVPIELHTANLSGPVAKTLTVPCNDPNQPLVTLEIKGTVWWPIEVTPQSVVFNDRSDSPSNAVTMVRIVNHLEEPLSLAEPESNHRALAAELKTVQPGREFQLVVKTVPPLGPGNVFGRITLRTSSPTMPVIEVPVFAVAPPVVTATPSPLVLPAGPITQKLSQAIAIRSAWSSPLKLSDPVLSVKGVDVHLEELQPGRSFTVTLKFPAGFEIARGEKVELSVKSNHPQFTVIKVPVVQAPRPGPTTPPPRPAAAPQ